MSPSGEPKVDIVERLETLMEQFGAYEIPSVARTISLARDEILCLRARPSTAPDDQMASEPENYIPLAMKLNAAIEVYSDVNPAMVEILRESKTMIHDLSKRVTESEKSRAAMAGRIGELRAMIANLEDRVDRYSVACRDVAYRLRFVLGLRDHEFLELEQAIDFDKGVQSANAIPSDTGTGSH